MSTVDQKISQLPTNPSIDGTAVVPAVFGGTTYQVNISQITSIVASGFGSAATYNVGLGGNAIPVLANANTWSDVQTITNGVKLRSSPSAGNPEAWMFSGSNGSLTFECNLQNPGSTQSFVFNPDGTLSIPGGFTFAGGLAISQGGTGATTAAGALTNLGAISNTGSYTWSAAQTFTIAPVFTDQAGTRTNLGLGTAATQASTAFASSATAVYGAGIITGGGPLSSTQTLTVNAAVAADIRAGTSTGLVSTPGGEYAALAEITFVYSSTNIVTSGTTLDMSGFLNGTITLTQNSVLPNPVNPKVGQTGWIRLVQDGTGSRTLSVSSYWKRQGGAATLSTSAGATDILEYQVITPTYILYDVKTGPS